MACLDENRLVWFLRGELTGSGASEVEAHLDHCGECRELFGVIASSSLLSLPHAALTAPEAAADEPAANELAAGATVGRYAILERIGIGGMGIVYAAHDPELDRKVALKLLRPELGALEAAGTNAGSLQPQLLSEARTLAQLSHPHVITVHDVGVHDAQVFTAMELVEADQRPHRPRWPGARARFWPRAAGRAAGARRAARAGWDAGLHGAGAARGRARRRALGSVQLLRRAVRGAVRRAAVRGPRDQHARDPRCAPPQPRPGLVEAAVGLQHPQMGQVLLDEAELHHGLGAHAAARDEAIRAAAVFRAALGAEAPEVAHALDAEGSALTGLGRASEAIDAHRRALAILSHALGADHPDLADTYVRLGEAELAAHRVPDAVTHLARALALYDHSTPGARVLAITRFELAGALAATEPARARALAEAARADWAKLAGHDQDAARVTAWLAAHPIARK